MRAIAVAAVSFVLRQNEVHIYDQARYKSCPIYWSQFDVVDKTSLTRT